MATRRWLWIGLAMAVVGGLVVAAAFVANGYVFRGSLIEPATPAADFQLTDQYGQPFHLFDQRGELVLIFFGYTNCPDVCPVTLVEYHRIRERLGDQAEKVHFVFITVDPERDTLERLSAHLANFDPAIVGLTGDPAVLADIWRAYGVAVEKRALDSAAGYAVDHTARIYLVDPGGNLRLIYPFDFDVDGIVSDIEHLLGE
jgi:protein SCO1/2